MATVDLSERAKDDLERIFEFLAEQDPTQAGAACRSIFDALKILEQHPLIGAPVDREQRRLVISYGRTGYVALYHFDPGLSASAGGAVLVTTICHQRESGMDSV